MQFKSKQRKQKSYTKLRKYGFKRVSNNGLNMGATTVVRGAGGVDLSSIINSETGEGFRFSRQPNVQSKG